MSNVYQQVACVGPTTHVTPYQGLNAFFAQSSLYWCQTLTLPRLTRRPGRFHGFGYRHAPCPRNFAARPWHRMRLTCLTQRTLAMADWFGLGVYRESAAAEIHTGLSRWLLQQVRSKTPLTSLWHARRGVGVVVEAIENGMSSCQPSRHQPAVNQSDSSSGPLQDGLLPRPHCRSAILDREEQERSSLCGWWLCTASHTSLCRSWKSIVRGNDSKTMKFSMTAGTATTDFVPAASQTVLAIISNACSHNIHWRQRSLPSSVQGRIKHETSALTTSRCTTAEDELVMWPRLSRLIGCAVNVEAFNRPAGNIGGCFFLFLASGYGDQHQCAERGSLLNKHT